MIAQRLAQLGAGALLAPLLPESAPTSEAPARLEITESRELLDFCLYNRLGPILGDAVATGRLVLDAETQAELTEALAHVLGSQLRVETSGLRVIDALLDAGVDFRVVKGMATAYLDYPNPSLRTFGDLDLLIRSSDMPRATDRLARVDGGAFRALRGGDWRLQHALPFIVDGVEVDLHVRLLHQAAGHRADRLDLFDGPEEFDIVGRRVLALPPWLRLVQAACQNVIGGSQQLTSDLDVARLAPDIDFAGERCRAVGLGWVFAEGVRRSQRSLGWGDPSTSTPAESWRERWFRRVYEGRRSSVVELSLLEIVSAPPAHGVRLVKSSVLPGPEYLARRGRTPRQQIIRQIERLRRG